MRAAPERHRAIKPVTLWDPVVRVSHWAIAVVVLLNAVLTEGGSNLHVWAGWIGLSLILMRLIWGFAGPQEARFSAFPPNPLAALAHLRTLARGERPAEHASHNPAGAMMAYTLWALLAVTTVTGLIMTKGATPMQIAADRAVLETGDWSTLVKDKDSVQEDDDDKGGAFGDAAEEVHELAANLILILVVLHVAGVALESRRMGRNLVAAMTFAKQKTRRG